MSDLRATDRTSRLDRSLKTLGLFLASIWECVMTRAAPNKVLQLMFRQCSLAKGSHAHRLLPTTNIRPNRNIVTHRR